LYLISTVGGIKLYVIICYFLPVCNITYVRGFVQETKLYFKERLKKRLRWKEISPLYNKWFVLMLFANLLIIVASMLKIFIAYQVSACVSVCLCGCIACVCVCAYARVCVCVCLCVHISSLWNFACTEIKVNACMIH